MLAGRPIVSFAEFVALGNLFAGVKVGSCSNHNASVVILDSWGWGKGSNKKNWYVLPYMGYIQLY